MAADLELSVEDKLYRVGVIPLYDIGDREVGDIVVLYNVTEHLSSIKSSILIFGSIFIIVGIVLFVFFFVVLGRVEMTLDKHSYDLENLLGKLKNANSRLLELDHLKSMFIASMSHELRTPLNSIIGFTGVILQGMAGEINDEQKDQLQRIYGSAKHLLALISDIIDISKIEAGKIKPYIEEFQLDETIKEISLNLKPQLEDKGLTLQTDVPHSIKLKTDKRRLTQCIVNYLSNAIKFTEEGQISIDANELDGRVEIMVRDSGIGIKEEDIPKLFDSKLFDSFVRLESPIKNKVLGTGLGLYLTKKIAMEILEGSVSVESNYGKGSTFILKISKEIVEKKNNND
jgi:signal transduction histidine kinase